MKKCYYFVFSPEIYDSKVYWFLMVAQGSSGIAAAVLNAIILRSIWKTPSLQKPSMILVFGLALTDFCVGAIAQPVVTIWIVTIINSGPFEVFCVSGMIAKYVSGGLMAVTGFTVTAISIDRYLAIHLRLGYRVVVTLKRVKCFIAFSWLFSLLLVIVQSVVQKEKLVFITLAIMGVVFSIIVIGSYTRAIFKLKAIKSQAPPCPNQSGSNSVPKQTFEVSKYDKSLKTMILIVVLGVMFHFPIISAGIVRGFGIKLHLNDWMVYYTVCEFMVLLNSTVNPCLYLWRMTDLRKAVKNSLTRQERRVHVRSEGHFRDKTTTVTQGKLNEAVLTKVRHTDTTT